MSKRNLELCASLFAALIFAFAAYELSQFAALAAGFPLTISVVGAVLATLHFVIVGTGRALKAKHRVNRDSGSPLERPSTIADEHTRAATTRPTRAQGVQPHDEDGGHTNQDEKMDPRRAAQYFGWTFALIALIWLLGGLIGAALFLLIFFIVDTKAKPIFCIVGPIAAFGVLYLMQFVLASVVFPEGALQLL